MKRNSMITLFIICVLLVITISGCRNNPVHEQEVPSTLPVITKVLPTNNSVEETTTTAEETESSEIYNESTTTVEIVTTELTSVVTEEETTIPEYPEYTFTDIEGKSMFVISDVNVRTLPSMDGEIVFVLSVDHEVWVTGVCNETGWYRIDVEGQTFYVSYVCVSETRYIPTQPATTTLGVAYTPPTQPVYTGGYVYYSINGVYPDRALEEYLYECLVDRGIAWWYPYAVAQIYQESNWNPNSTNGRDHGICQFNGESFSARAAHHAGYPEADIWNPYDSIYVYSYYIRDVLAGVGWDVNAALSFYITGNFNKWNSTYVNYVLNWYNQLQKQ